MTVQEEATIADTPPQVFEDVPSLLPGGAPPAEAMRTAQEKMRFRSVQDAACFSRGWKLPSCERLLAAFAWHAVYSGRFPAASSPEAADRLFSHIAIMHARVFADSAIAADVRVKDALAWYLPEALSHAACSALQRAYPKDKDRFDETLRRALFEQFVGWTSGHGGTTGRRVTPQDDRPSEDALSGLAAHLNGSPRTSALGAANDHRRNSPRMGLSELLGAEDGAPAAPPVLPKGAKGRYGAVPKAGGGGGVGKEGTEGEEGAASPRRSMVVGGLPAVKRETRDVSACSPLMARWLKLRTLESAARGGSSSREPHRVRCSHAAGRGFEAMDELIAQGATTFRDVRHEADQRTRKLVDTYSDNLRETFSDTTNSTMHARLQISALRSEEARVFAKGPETTRDYANYLCAMRTLWQESDEVKHARDAAGH